MPDMNIYMWIILIVNTLIFIEETDNFALWKLVLIIGLSLIPFVNVILFIFFIIDYTL